jgi:hypothetical protein
VLPIPHAEVRKGSSEASPVQLACLLTQLLMKKQNQGFVLSKSDFLDSNFNVIVNSGFNKNLIFVKIKIIGLLICVQHII